MERNRRLTFLDLPDQARRSIYALAGLTRPCPIDFLSSRPAPGRMQRNDRRHLFHYGCWYKLRLTGGKSQFEPGTPLCACQPLPLELTLVCRQVREEALDVFLGTNVFVARGRHGQPDTLTPLLTGIPLVHLARMTRMVIRLNCWPCPWGHDMTGQMGTYVRSNRVSGGIQPSLCTLCGTHRREADPLLSLSSPGSLRTIDAWGQICRRLGSERQPGQTDLTLICEVDGEDAAARLLSPLMEFLPPLRSCTIRLRSNAANKKLAEIARNTALALTEPRQESPSPFPFGRLPQELRLNILKYTHLSPPELAGYHPDFAMIQVVNGRLIRGRSRGANFSFVDWCCGVCTGTIMDCCCLGLHASFSPSCTCRVLPTGLFLADRNTRLSALETFFPTTRFILRHDDLSAMLTSLPTAAVPLLRNIVLALTPAQCYFWTGRAPTPPQPAWHLRQVDSIYFPHVFPSPDHPVYRDVFEAILTALASEGTAPLYLELDLTATEIFADLFFGEFDGDEEERYRWTYDLYRDVAEAVKGAFEPELGDGSRRRLESVRFRLGTFTDLEPWLGREVLGERFDGGRVVDRPTGTRRMLSEMAPQWHVW